MTARRIVLVRHGEIDEALQGVCYGRSDVGLSDAGMRTSHRAAEQLAALPLTYLCHSGLTRARILANLIEQHCGIAAVEAPGIREIDFGSWELRPWTAILQEHGASLSAIVDAPDSFRPGGGETLGELRHRVLEWHRSLPAEGLIVAVTHGGPIATLRGTLANLEPRQWLSLVPDCGTFVDLQE